MGRIRFWATLAESYRYTFGNLRLVHALAEPWLTIIMALYPIGAAIALWSPGRAAIVFLGFVGFPITAMGTVVFATAWHRAILLGERPAAGPRLRVGPREWRYLGYAVAIAAIILAGMLLVTLVAVLLLPAAARGLEGVNGNPVALLIESVVLIGGLWCYGRLALILPAVALDQSGQLFRWAWTRSRGNGARLIAGLLLPYFSIYLLVLPYLTLVDYAVGDDLPLAILLQLPLVAVSFVQVALPVAFVSLAYRQLTETVA